VLRLLPQSADPNLLVGFDTRDDAGVYLLPDGKALVQTVDFFTPIVDDPYAYGAIAAANALSDVYAMGGVPLTVLNIACFAPDLAPPDVWAAILQGAFDKTTEAGAAVVGGHTVEDREPKFGMAVTGLVDPARVFSNANAKPGDRIFLTKPLGTGILTTAAKCDAIGPDSMAEAIASMSYLNREAMEAGQRVGCRCATDITGFGLAGHLANIARASGVEIQLSGAALPAFPQVRELTEAGHNPGGAGRNRTALGELLRVEAGVPEWIQNLVVDPQTSGGLALFCVEDPGIGVEIGHVMDGGVPGIVLAK